MKADTHQSLDREEAAVLHALIYAREHVLPGYGATRDTAAKAFADIDARRLKLLNVKTR